MESKTVSEVQCFVHIERRVFLLSRAWDVGSFVGGVVVLGKRLGGLSGTVEGS